MKNKLLVLSLVLSLLLIACGSDVKQETTSESSTVEKEETVEEEVKEDIEEETEDDSDINCLIDESYKFGETGKITLQFTEQNDSISFSSYIYADDIKELSVATAYWYMFSNSIVNEYDGVNEYYLTASQYNGLASVMATSKIFQSVEVDGTVNELNEKPEWFNELPDDTDSYSDRFSEIWIDFSNAFAEKYSE